MTCPVFFFFFFLPKRQQGREVKRGGREFSTHSPPNARMMAATTLSRHGSIRCRRSSAGSRTTATSEVMLNEALVSQTDLLHPLDVVGRRSIEASPAGNLGVPEEFDRVTGEYGCEQTLNGRCDDEYHHAITGPPLGPGDADAEVLEGDGELNEGGREVVGDNAKVQRLDT